MLPVRYEDDDDEVICLMRLELALGSAGSDDTFLVDFCPHIMVSSITTFFLTYLVNV